MKRINHTLIIIVLCMLCLNKGILAQDSLILPMPGQTQKTNTTPSSQKTSQSGTTSSEYSKPNPTPKNSKESTDGSILPLPNLDKKNQSQPKTKPEKPVNTQSTKSSNQVNLQNEPLITIPPMDNPKKNTTIPPTPPSVKVTEQSANKTPLSIEDDDSGFFNNDNDFSDSNNEIPPAPSSSEVDNILPPTGADTTVAQDSSGEKITVFPKDSGSAIFMVMKSWQCEDYDASSLITQALDVYGKDAAETYQIKGLENIQKGLTVSVEEEDITFDELLDILGSKTGNDWGCDIANKTIYIYPKGIKTESYVSWE